MLITSLSVPGAHLQCKPRLSPEIEPKNMYKEISKKISQAYVIWRGAGMSIQGVRTCGDYMFSGHTVALTMLNFFITEYTPRNLYFLHTMTWLMNMFGIFFILAAHEHYSIDVFVAFYITSRLFLYYHTLSNNQALMQRDSTRTRVWFPMFSFFESSVDGMIPNEFETPVEIIYNIFGWIKDTCLGFSFIESILSTRYIHSNLAFIGPGNPAASTNVINTDAAAISNSNSIIAPSISKSDIVYNNAIKAAPPDEGKKDI